MKKTIVSLMTVSLVAVASMTGCADLSENQRNTGIGAGVGAATGAVLGSVMGGGSRSRNVAVGAALGAAVGAGGGYLWSKHMQEQKAAMEQATSGTGVSVTQTPDNQLRMDIPSDISFDPGHYNIKPDMQRILDKFAVSLNQNPVTTISIIGHTDSSGSDAINNPLSVNRAAAVRDYLGSRGVDRQRIAIDGRGSTQPVADNSTPQGRAKNRRVEIFVAEARK